MSTGLTSFAGTDTLNAAGLTSRMDTIEDWLQRTAIVGDLQSGSSWARRVHVYRPEFYGSPDRRAVMVSGEPHWRRTGFDLQERSLHHPDIASADLGGAPADSDGWTTVRNMGCSLPIHEDSTEIRIVAAWYVWEAGGALATFWGGGPAPAGTWNLGSNFDTFLCGQVALFVDGVYQSSTRKDLYASSDDDLVFSRKNQSLVFRTTMNEGEHHVDLRCRVRDINSNFRHVYVEGRTLLVRPRYL